MHFEPQFDGRGSSMRHKLLYLLVLLATVIPTPAKIAPANAGEPPGSCAVKDCHTDMRTVLPENHMKVEGKDNVSACMQCHLPSSETLKDTHVFSAKIHKKHVMEKKTECSYCHAVQEDLSFTLPGRESIGIPDKETMKFLPDIAAEWAKSPFLAARHARKNVACSSCHGGKLPVLDDKPGNETCFTCHKSYAVLAAKTPGKYHPSRNPHGAHLGSVNCTICHKAHEPSIIYCKNCHKFDMNPIPAGN